MELTITIFDTEALVNALQAVEGALTDPRHATDALTLARDVLSSMTVKVEQAIEDEAAERLDMRWMR